MSQFQLYTLWLAFGLSLCSPVGLPGAEAVLKAGAAKRDISPHEPLPMWGYGARHDQLSEGILDPLMAAAVVIQVGETKLAIVGLDLGRSPAEQSLQTIRQRIKAEAGIEHSFIAGSHTHHGPVLELTDREGKGKGRFNAALRYYQQLEDAIVATIVEADRKLEPAKIATGAMELDGFNRNRHTRQPVKPVDRMLAVMRLDNAADQPIAVLVNFAGHPTSLPAQTLQFSADYVGAVKATVEQELGGTAVFMQGASGDLSINKGMHADHVGFGQALGREVVKLASSMKSAGVERPSLVIREERYRFESRTDLNNLLVRAAYSLAFFPELVANFVDEYADGIRPRLTVAVLNGDIAFVGASGEFFCQHAIQLRERARVEKLFFFGYCNGYHQYFPTIEAAAEGGYGADNQVAPVAVGAGEQLMNTALMWIYQIQGKLK
ncbi:MAG: neutral/alkaline non-lysosomal ceramidase N-terminal domain-containing protein [Planctomycetaceae bacterium]|nr:neutral/alkaline non-lysosomal ceramidase N-terminal domain-containing protein [Planctomycetaceae bacterium]